MLSTQELFTQKLLPKIQFVLHHYSGGFFDENATILEAGVQQLLTSDNATQEQYKTTNNQICRVQTTAFNIVLVLERLRGQLIASAIDCFATTEDGAVNEEEKKVMLRDVFGICPDTARRIINLSNLFLVYPRLMFTSCPPAIFISLWKPLNTWLDENPDEAAQLKLGFGAFTLSAGVSLLATESVEDLPEVYELEAHDRQYMPEYTGYYAHLLQGGQMLAQVVPNQAQVPPPVQDATEVPIQVTVASKEAAGKRVLKMKGKVSSTTATADDRHGALSPGTQSVLDQLDQFSTDDNMANV